MIATEEELPDLIVEVGAKDRSLAEGLLEKLHELIEIGGGLKHLIAASYLEDMLEGATGEDLDQAEELDALIWVGVASNEDTAAKVMNAMRASLVVGAPVTVGWTCKPLGLAELRQRTALLWRRKKILDRQS